MGHFTLLCKFNDPDDPFLLCQKTSGTSIEEMDEAGEEDPMAEEFTSPVEGITRRYPDRLIVKSDQSNVPCTADIVKEEGIGQKIWPCLWLPFLESVCGIYKK